MSVTYVGDKKYTIETTVYAFEYFELSKAAYSCLRKHFELQVHVHWHESYLKWKLLMTALT